MRTIILALSFFVFFISNIFANNVCSSFVSAEKWQHVDTIERGGVCYIDDQTQVDSLLFEVQKKYFDEQFKKEFVVLSKGKTFAVLVSSDMLYALEDGNEAWWHIGAPGVGEIITAFTGKRTGDNAGISPHHGRTMDENRKLRRENRQMKKELAERRTRERERNHREWQDRADRWSGERGVSPR